MGEVRLDPLPPRGVIGALSDLVVEQSRAETVTR
jgi:hypothetical protein